MATEHLSRRNFLSTIAATGALATTQLSPLGALANPAAVSNDNALNLRSPDEIIRIVCTADLSHPEAEQIKSAGRNVNLLMVNDSKDSKQIADAEVILGAVDAATEAGTF